MCIGVPLRVIEAWSDRALAAGRGRSETVDTRLVGACAPGDWLLVFQGAARERLHAQRAAEIDRALDLLEAGMSGDAAGAAADPGFELPSAMSAAQLAALTGATRPPSGDLP
ncbi:MAG TPA: HypC/HybG/HupF family hydrogenase formation chaperone [Burkholderiaceae bacterium]|nr:HypC/HybG/HupF family hydrogenase formation chaperone [Burkholderiaceae bacterium]